MASCRMDVVGVSYECESLVGHVRMMNNCTESTGATVGSEVSRCFREAEAYSDL